MSPWPISINNSHSCKWLNINFGVGFGDHEESDSDLGSGLNGKKEKTVRIRKISN
jgi:hypothetical protein